MGPLQSAIWPSGVAVVEENLTQDSSLWFHFSVSSSMVPSLQTMIWSFAFYGIEENTFRSRTQ